MNGQKKDTVRQNSEGTAKKTHIVKQNQTKLLLLISFIMPVFIMAFAYYMKGIYPGGPNTVLSFDLRSQYMPFFASLRYLGKTDNSIFLNMSGSLGNNFWGFAYYIFSPFTWLTVLFPLEELPTALYLTYLLRIGLCGACFCYYLIVRYDDKQHALGKILLSCCYALMAYNIGYSINLMWLDGVFMLPLILTGIERILRDNKPTMLIVTIAFSLICNYYITGMALIFVAIYTIIRLTEDNCWSVKRVIRLVVSGLIGLGLSMPVVLPGVIALRDGKMEEGTKPVTSFFHYNFFDLLGQLLSGRYDTLYFDGLPFIFCGTGTILLVILFFVSGRYSKKIRLTYGVAVLYYLLAMCISPIDIAMQGFKRPSCFEVRYSFTFSCLLLIVAYKGLDCLSMLKEKYRIKSKVFDIIFALFVVFELYMNASILLAGIAIEVNYTTATEYEMILSDKQNLLNLIEDDDFYRISNDIAYTYNDGAWLGYNGIGYFSTCYNLSVMNYLGSLGECQSYHILEDNDRTPLMESVFGARYKLSTAENRRADEVIGKSGFFTLSKNKDALSLGYMTVLNENTNMTDVSGNAFENQNILAEELSGISDDVFVELPVNDYEVIDSEGYAKHVKFWVETKENAPVWLYIERTPDEEARKLNDNEEQVADALLINGVEQEKYKSKDTGATFTLYLGVPPKGERIEIELKDSYGFGKIHLDFVDQGVYDRVIEKLKSNQVILQEHVNGHFRGSIDAGDGGTMLLTLPAIDGWKVTVDGIKVVPGCYRDALLTLELSPGKHDIDMCFISPGLIIGFIVMIISAVVWMCMEVMKSRKTIGSNL